jgi:hypothetical protein
MRPADLPPFLADLLADHLVNAGRSKCTCRNTEQPWCPGAEYVFLGPGRGQTPPTKIGSHPAPEIGHQGNDRWGSI